MFPKKVENEIRIFKNKKKRSKKKGYFRYKLMSNIKKRRLNQMP